MTFYHRAILCTQFALHAAVATKCYINGAACALDTSLFQRGRRHRRVAHDQTGLQRLAETIDCSAMGGTDCSDTLRAWGGSETCIYHVVTNGGSCHTFCTQRNLVCVKAMDDQGGCDLHEEGHTRQSIVQNGCLQNWTDQICVCGLQHCDDETYEEGRVTSAEYPKNWYDSEADAQAACSSDDDCKGYWEREGGVFFILKSGSRTFERGVPHSSVISVKVKKDALAPSPSPQTTSQPTPRPPATGTARDTKTVAPEEWAYFLAFQESRRTGFSCPCGHSWGGCSDPQAFKNYHPPNSEKATFDCTLWVAAYRHADDQASQGYFSHTGKDGRSPRQRAEDVGAVGGPEHQAGWHSTGPAALRGLQTSPGHCNSMFQRSFRGVAVGHGARRNDPRGDGDIWTVMYNWGGDDISDSESCIPEGYTATGDRK